MKKTLMLILVGALLGSTVAFAASKFFSDVPANTWYTDAVSNLSEKGIIEGYSDGTFGPTNNVNRAELAVMLDRLIEYMETGEVSSSESNETSSWKTYSSTGVTIKYPDDGTYSVETYDNGFTVTQAHPGNRVHVRTTNDSSALSEEFTIKVINGKTYMEAHSDGEEGDGYSYAIEHNGQFYHFTSIWGPTNEVFELMMTTVIFE